MAVLCLEKRQTLAQAFEAVAWKCVNRLNDSDIIDKCSNPTQLTTAAGTTVDKSQLLSGLPTQITGTAETAISSWLKECGGTREEAVRYLGEFLPEVRDLGKVG